MTQHYYPAKGASGNPVEIMVGWDRPLGEVFANVFALKANGQLEEFPVVSTMEEGVGQGMAAPELEQWLKGKGYAMPEAVQSALDSDIVFNRGNATTRYDASGNVQAGNH